MQGRQRRPALARVEGRGSEVHAQHACTRCAADLPVNILFFGPYTPRSHHHASSHPPNYPPTPPTHLPLGQPRARAELRMSIPPWPPGFTAPCGGTRSWSAMPPPEKAQAAWAWRTLANTVGGPPLEQHDPSLHDGPLRARLDDAAPFLPPDRQGLGGARPPAADSALAAHGRGAVPGQGLRRPCGAHHDRQEEEDNRQRRRRQWQAAYSHRTEEDGPGRPPRYLGGRLPS